jgi:hypothetical protein
MMRFTDAVRFRATALSLLVCVTACEPGPAGSTITLSGNETGTFTVDVTGRSDGTMTVITATAHPLPPGFSQFLLDIWIAGDPVPKDYSVLDFVGGGAVILKSDNKEYTAHVEYEDGSIDGLHITTASAITTVSGTAEWSIKGSARATLWPHRSTGATGNVTMDAEL